MLFFIISDNLKTMNFKYEKVKFDTNCSKVCFRIAEFLGQSLNTKTVLNANNALTATLTLFQFLLYYNF